LGVLPSGATYADNDLKDIELAEETEATSQVESVDMTSIDMDVLTEWVQDHPDQLSNLYKGNSTAIASLAEFMDVSEDLISACVPVLKAQNDILVQAIEDGTDVLGILSSDTTQEAAEKLGVDTVAIDLFRIKLSYVSGLLNESLEKAVNNGQKDSWYQKLGKALDDEDLLAQAASPYDVEPAVFGALLRNMGIEAIKSTTLVIKNVELDIPDGVNDQFVYQIYLWTTSSSGSISPLTGYYDSTYFKSLRLTYLQAYNNNLPYSSYYNYYGYATVALSAGESVIIPDLPEGCSYKIICSASANYYIRNLTVTYGTVDDQIGTIYVDGASGHNKVICVNDYAPNSFRLSEEVISSDPDSVNDEFTFTIYLYSHGSSQNTPLFKEDTVAVEIATDGIDGVEAPDLGSTLTFTKTESITLPGLSIPGIYNVATVTLKHGQNIVLKHLGSNYGCYIYQTPEIHYILYTLKSRHVYSYGTSEYEGSYDDYYTYIDTCNVSSSAGFTNAQVTLSITKLVEGSDTTRNFTFNVYFLQYLPGSSNYMTLREGTFNLSYTNPTGNEPQTVQIQLRSDISKQSTLTDNVTGDTYTVDWAVAQIQVAAGQTVTIEELPAGIAYYIEEVPVTNYTLTSATTTATYGVVSDGVVYTPLSTVDESATFTNTYVPPVGNDLTISKTVTGSLGDTNQTFSFHITLTDQDGNTLSDQDIQVLLPDAGTATMYTTDTNGSLILSLKHGQQVTLQNLPQGTQYTITETNATTYTTTFSVIGGTTYDTSADQSQSGALTGSSDVSVEVINDRTLVIPTGIQTEVQPFLLLLSFSLTFLLMIIMGKRKNAH
jgi:hypothetical protein